MKNPEDNQPGANASDAAAQFSALSAALRQRVVGQEILVNRLQWHFFAMDMFWLKAFRGLPRRGLSRRFSAYWMRTFTVFSSRPIFCQQTSRVLKYFVHGTALFIFNPDQYSAPGTRRRNQQGTCEGSI
jgi:hypothetical protein